MSGIIHVTGKGVDAMVDVGCAIFEGTAVNHVGMCLFLMRHFGGDGRIEVDDFVADVNRDKGKEVTDGGVGGQDGHGRGNDGRGN